MNSRSLSRLRPILWAIALGVASEIVYFVLTTYVEKLELDYRVTIDLLIVAFLLVALWQAGKYYYVVRQLGVIRIYDKAEETTRKGLQEANSSYWWLGTSAYYVLCSPATRENYIETKVHTDFVFITVDPRCPPALVDQARWEHRPPDEVAERIGETQRTIQRLSQHGVNIVWQGHSTFPTFRVVIVNSKKVLVSFYEQGKLGPECKQLEIDADGLLGQWFIQFFEKSRADVTRMRMERALSNILFTKANVEKEELLEELRAFYPEHDGALGERVVEQLQCIQSEGEHEE